MTNNVMSEQDLETAVSACIESILWTGYYILEAETEPILLNPDYTVDDVSPEVESELKDRISSFVETYSAEVHAYIEAITTSLTSRDEAWVYFGHDYALTCNRHGAGFWDRGMGEVGEELTAAAVAESGFSLYPGDDNLLYLES